MYDTFSFCKINSRLDNLFDIEAGVDGELVNRYMYGVYMLYTHIFKFFLIKKEE